MRAAFFRNGILYHVEPHDNSKSLCDNREVAYDARSVIVSDGDTYDPLQPNSVSNLSVPLFTGDGTEVVFDLSYILKMRCGLVENQNIISVFINKTLELMEASPIVWGRKDYLQVIHNYYRLGLFEVGDAFEAQYRSTHNAIFGFETDEIHEADCLRTKYYYESKWRRYQEYYKLKEMFPEIVPKTPRGYLQIRTRKTKRFFEIVSLAKSAGFIFDEHTDCHYCRKHNTNVLMLYQSELLGNYPITVSCSCPICTLGKCDGYDEFNNPCIYPVLKMS